MEGILYIIAIGVVLLLGVIIYIIIESQSDPFSYPRIVNSIDISGRKQPSYRDCVEQWVIDNRNYNAVKDCKDILDKWDNACKEILQETRFGKKRKTQMYNEMKANVYSDKYKIYQYDIFRSQVRYRQQNYQKYSYSVRNTQFVYELTLKELLEIYAQLEEINFETTLQKYYAKNQRKLMTKELRQSIIERDNYTCQKCGKYMPDEVGLHVDHIISIKKGGKTTESNLQVLCDKCNYRKGSKQ